MQYLSRIIVMSIYFYSSNYAMGLKKTLYKEIIVESSVDNREKQTSIHIKNLPIKPLYWSSMVAIDNGIDQGIHVFGHDRAEAIDKGMLLPACIKTIISLSSDKRIEIQFPFLSLKPSTQSCESYASIAEIEVKSFSICLSGDEDWSRRTLLESPSGFVLKIEHHSTDNDIVTLDLESLFPE